MIESGVSLSLFSAVEQSGAKHRKDHQKAAAETKVSVIMNQESAQSIPGHSSSLMV
jgi:hypothetical protein